MQELKQQVFDANMDLSRYVRADSRATLTLDWAGVCALRPCPLALDKAGHQGWYAPELLREVLALTWQPVSSLKLVNPENSLILSSYDYALPMNRQVRRLANTNKQF